MNRSLIRRPAEMPLESSAVDGKTVNLFRLSTVDAFNSQIPQTLSREWRSLPDA
jgi:hypothetical protein